MAVASVSPLYLKLIRKFPLRPIRTEEELDRAIVVVDSLVDPDGRTRWRRSRTIWKS